MGMLGGVYVNQAVILEHSIDWTSSYVIVGIEANYNEVPCCHPYFQLSFKILNEGSSWVSIGIARAQVSLLLGEDCAWTVVGIGVGAIAADDS
jgi:hypothetical protein